MSHLARIRMTSNDDCRFWRCARTGFAAGNDSVTFLYKDFLLQDTGSEIRVDRYSIRQGRFRILASTGYSPYAGGLLRCALVGRNVGPRVSRFGRFAGDDAIIEVKNDLAEAG